MSSKRRIIPAAQAEALPPASFKPFERRPVNYFRSMIATDEERAEVPQPSEQELHGRIAEAVSAERARLECLHQQDAQAAVPGRVGTGT